MCANAPHTTRPAAATCGPQSGQRFELGASTSSLALGEGRWVVEVHVPAQRYVTLGLAGPVDALVSFDVLGKRALRRLRTGSKDDDGLLPSFVSFRSAEQDQQLSVVVDVKKPVRLLRAAVDVNDIGARTPHDLKSGKVQPRSLIGLPSPIERRAGYFLQTPTRYLFVRTDVAAALRAAFKQTKIRFSLGSIFVGDATQWNGQRPATDLGRPRHISHAEGRDIDLGLPAKKNAASLLKRRCEGVMVEKDQLECAPGTVKRLDALRLAYFLGLLLDGPTPHGRYVPKAEHRPGPIAIVESILTDQAYVDEIRKALVVLRRKRWIHDEAFGALGEEGLLRHSPWHVDHVHVRFQGEPAAVPVVLQFKPTVRERVDAGTAAAASAGMSQ